MFIYENKDWPCFTWNKIEVSGKLAKIKLVQGKLLGKMQSIGFDLQDQASLLTLTEDVIKTSAIEGESLNKSQVRSSIATKLGIELSENYHVDRHVEGIVQIMIDATTNYDKPLCKDRLYDWHAALFPTGRSGMSRIVVGGWRNSESGVMQVISGAFGKEKIHFEAPSFERISSEMDRFIAWFNDEHELDLVLKSAIAHLWFVTIHPFADGNGRICRALSDMLLARSEGCTRRFYSMSSRLQHDRKKYYDILEKTQKSSLDISGWILWYLATLESAIINSDAMLNKILSKAQFWYKHYNTGFNDRQKKMLNRLFDGFEGKLTSSKWAKICQCSQDTAGRDIVDLLKKNILQKSGSSGRSTYYELLYFSCK